MQYEVVITPSGKADIFETNTWLLENYPQLADKWLWETSKAVTSLAKMPERCLVSPESAAFDGCARGEAFFAQGSNKGGSGQDVRAPSRARKLSLLPSLALAV